MVRHAIGVLGVCALVLAVLTLPSLAADPAEPEQAPPVAAEPAQPPTQQPPPSTATQQMEELVVTSRKREEQLQDVPIAVSAFSDEGLDKANIEDVADIQFNVPNLHYTKTNFMGAGNISLRGVGNLATAATAEAGTGIHVNEAPFAGARIFETEFFDQERVEVLRGPQGTLFGRSAPGGTVNLYTKRPYMEEYGGYLEGQYGDYDHMKLKGAVNVPIGEHIAARVAGYWFDRDGITENIATGHDIDDRHVYAIRGSIAGEWENFDFNLMASWFEENDNRMRINKQACTTDTQPWPNSIGCLGGNNELGTDPMNYAATLAYSVGNVIDTFHVLTTLGAFGPGVPIVPRFHSGPLAVFTPYFGVFPGVTTSYLLDDATAAAIGLPPASFFGAPSYGAPTPYYQGSKNPGNLRKVNTQLDPEYWTDEFMATLSMNYNVTEALTLTSVTGWHDWTNNSKTDYFWANPAVPFSDGPRHYDFPNGGQGGTYNSEFVFDQSWGTGFTFFQELRLTSDFGGPIDFTFGANYIVGEADLEYAVWAASLEAFWDMPGDPFKFFGAPFCASAAAITAAGGSCHDAYPRQSYYLNETKPTEARSWAVFGEAYWDVLEHTHLTLGARYTDDHKEGTDRVNLWVDGINPFDHITGDWRNFTWKAGVSQDLALPFAPDSILYFNVTTGFKGGGFNPAVDTNVPGTTVPRTFDEEEITAYEAGYKAVLFDRLIFNVTGFFYDYEGMQISKIVNRTAINENADVELWGAELETVLSLTEALQVDFNLAWLQTEIQNLDSVDPANPTAGVPGWITIKQLLPFPAGQNSICLPSINPLCVEGTPLDASDFSDGYLPDGFVQDLKGNELPNASEWSFKIGAQYTIDVFAGWQLTPRVDYYWHDESWGRVYNTEKDKIDSWSQLDSQIVLRQVDGPWLIELWGKNLENNDDVTGHYFTDATSANFTNLFILEPRTFGVTVRYTFGGG